ncbi:NmrA family NAD(P)-binding protein [Streptomyces sp. NPDC059534]|uniref:NmrA family NAD(P)-binding protein n=1 Tax=Streptomyces sp. NPDC059534 TaxID=3346859 RepID=UPI0036886F17
MTTNANASTTTATATATTTTKPYPKPRPTLVLGGTGKTGRRVADRLRQRGHEVRAASRNGPARFDWNDENTWEPVLDGVGAAYLVDSMQSDAATALSRFAELAASGGVERLVLLSHRDWVVPDGEEKLPCERAVRESGTEWTLLKPSWFAQNFSEDPFFRGQILDGEVVWSAGAGTEPFVDVDDIADVAVAALTENGHAGQTYELSGPRLMSLGDVAAEIARATGRTISYRPVSPDTFAAHAARQGLPEDFTALLNTLFHWIGDNRFATLADGVQRALHRDPRDFADYARTTATTGLWSPPA